ncbi:MAG: hypothetical protein KatS3mg101_0880 [Patescibacteria group bacterium]|nr:MAG: hypothetical protein KatS3mg101_0880 [Patescibacteria group bacterium]
MNLELSLIVYFLVLTITFVVLRHKRFKLLSSTVLSLIISQLVLNVLNSPLDHDGEINSSIATYYTIQAVSVIIYFSSLIYYTFRDTY